MTEAVVDLDPEIGDGQVVDVVDEPEEMSTPALERPAARMIRSDGAVHKPAKLYMDPRRSMPFVEFEWTPSVPVDDLEVLTVIVRGGDEMLAFAQQMQAGVVGVVEGFYRLEIARKTGEELGVVYASVLGIYGLED